MNRSDADAARIVRIWLGDGSTTLSERVRADVLGALPATRQDAPEWWRRRPAVVGGDFRFAIATAVVAVLVVVGASLLPQIGGLVPAAPTASPPPPSLAAAPTLPLGAQPLAPGEHLISEVAPVRLTISLPAGWIGGPFGSTWWTGNDNGRGAVSFTTGVHSACMDDSTLDRSAVSINGFGGERIEFTSASPCHPNRLFDELGAPPGRGPDWLVTIWVLDVGGINLIMIAATGPSDPAELNVLRRLVESVHIEAPSATPLPVEVWRPLAGGLHVITEVAPLILTVTMPSGWDGGRWGSRGWSAAKDGYGGIGFTTAASASCLDIPSLDRFETTIDGFVGERIEIALDSACSPNEVLDQLGAGPGRGQMWLNVWVLDVNGVRLWMIAVTGSGSTGQDAVAGAYLRRLVESVHIEAP